jgi:hypothetical protein
MKRVRPGRVGREASQGQTERAERGHHPLWLNLAAGKVCVAQGGRGAWGGLGGFRHRRDPGRGSACSRRPNWGRGSRLSCSLRRPLSAAAAPDHRPPAALQVTLTSFQTFAPTRPGANRPRPATQWPRAPVPPRLGPGRRVRIARFRFSPIRPLAIHGTARRCPLSKTFIFTLSISRHILRVPAAPDAVTTRSATSRPCDRPACANSLQSPPAAQIMLPARSRPTAAGPRILITVV